MPHIDLPDGEGSPHDRMYLLRPEYAAPAAAMLDAVWNHTILPPRLAEAVRYRIAMINGCLLCMQARNPAAAAAGFDEADYAEVGTWSSSNRFDDQEQLALDFAERFACDHHSIDAMWPRLRAAFTDAELVDLAFYVGRFLSFGRLTHVLGLDDACGLVPPSVPS